MLIRTCNNGEQSPPNAAPNPLTAIILWFIPQLCEADGVPHAVGHAHAGVRDDVQQEEGPEHRGGEHRIFSDKFINILVLAMSLTINNRLFHTGWLHYIFLIVRPKTIHN